MCVGGGGHTDPRTCPRHSSCCTVSPARTARGTVWSSVWTPNAIARWRWTCPGTASRPTLSARSRSRAASSTCSRGLPSASPCAATRWAAAWPCTSRWRPPSACRGSCSCRRTAGIEDDDERAERSAADRRLADELEGGSLEDFVARWCAQPMFAEDPPAVDVLAREDYRRNTPDAIAAVLRGIGTGEMAPLWERLR